MKTIFANIQLLLRKAAKLLTDGLALIMYSFLALLVVVIFFALPFSKLSDPTFDTMPITNYSFAIMGSCAAICFSWTRNVEPSNTKLVKQITFCGERCFLAAIIFLLASGLKFFVIHQADSHIRPHSPLILIMAILNMFSFAISLMIGLSALFNIIKLLSKHVTTTQKFEDL
jgi:hypothetical protein